MDIVISIFFLNKLVEFSILSPSIDTFLNASFYVDVDVLYWWRSDRPADCDMKWSR